jgi:hypothetical protein
MAIEDEININRFIQDMNMLIWAYYSVEKEFPKALRINSYTYRIICQRNYIHETPNSIPTYFYIPVYIDNYLPNYNVDCLSYYCPQCRNTGVILNSNKKEHYCECERGQTLRIQESSGLADLMTIDRFKYIIEE